MTGGAGGVGSAHPSETSGTPSAPPPDLWDSMHLLAVVRWSPMLPEEYHGPHAANRQGACERIEWTAVSRPLARARVLSHTCECLATVYELCGLGGGYFIRRTTRGPSGPAGDVVHESAHLPAARTGDLWFRLLRGRAR